MSEISALPGELLAKMRFHSMGLKLIVVCGLALVMIIPALFVWLLIDDRSKRATDVVNEISEYVGGQQTFLGPTLAIPYTIPALSPTDAAKHGIYLVFPSRATGTVKVNYLQDGSAQGSGTPAAQAESTHILAERGELQHASGLATFYGGPARLWQGGSQVQAPVIEFARKQQRLTARGEASTGGASGTQAAQVHTVLASAGDDRPGAANSATSKPNAPKKEAGKAGPESPMPSVVRIASNRLVYSEDLRQAEFSGGVRAETVNGAIHASEATVYLQQSAGQAAASRGASAMAVASTEEAVPSLAGSVERMVATGQIEIEQPGRRATGERLEYTASDQLFVLTGECKVQPRLVDATRGTVTGAVLRFHTGDDSVVVSKGLACATGDTPSGRVRAETDAGKDATIGKGK